MLEKYLPVKLVDELRRQPACARAEELRMRAGVRPSLYADGAENFFGDVLTRRDIEETVHALSGRSLSAHAEELKNGYITVEDGIRVGIAGRVVAVGGRVRVMRDFTSLNIRFPREMKGIAADVLPHILVNGRLAATLIVSAPQHGKTTLMRDIIRAVSSGEGVKSAKCTVVDERMELWANGAFDLGPRTDVLSGCPKHLGLAMAGRSLSPEILATDEIGGERELGAVLEAAVSGIRLLATAHGGGYRDIVKRPYFAELIKSGCIERIIEMSETLGRGTVERVLTSEGSAVCAHPFLPRAK